MLCKNGRTAISIYHELVAQKNTHENKHTRCNNDNNNNDNDNDNDNNVNDNDK